MTIVDEEEEDSDDQPWDGGEQDDFLDQEEYSDHWYSVWFYPLTG